VAWNLIGQERAIELLRRGLAAGRLSHAYLFTGPPHVGKTTLALALAQALNCEQPEPPCGQCRPCRLIARGIHSDVRTIELREGKSKISFEEIEALQHDAALRPLEARHKVYLLREVQLLSATAANQLLKTLEEPPTTVVLLLTAPEAEALLPTMVSRCQEVPLRPVAQETLRRELVSRGLEPARADLLARLSEGRPGWALGAAHNPGILDERASRLQDLRQLLDGDRLARLRLAKLLAQRWSRAADDGARGAEAVREALRTWIGWWRDLAFLHAGLEREVVNADEHEHLRLESGRFPSGAPAGAIARLEQALDDLERNVSPRLALEAALLGLPAREPGR